MHQEPRGLNSSDGSVDIKTKPNTRASRAIEQFQENPRLRYVRSNTVGLGVAHNVGLAHARADIVAMTDDDCGVDNNWMQEIAAVFAQNPRVAVVYCNVVPVLPDPSLGFVSSYVTSSSRLMTQMRDFCAPHGIGAGFAVRRKVLMEKGGFDNLLGSGRSGLLFRLDHQLECRSDPYRGRSPACR